jgi:hypothetical protein
MLQTCLITNWLFVLIFWSALYYKNITIVKTPLESSEVMLQVVALPIIIILTTLEVSFMILENIYSTDITLDYHH